MTRLVALLRGVNNIGASKRVAMAELRALVEDLGYRDVRTLLNSGNVVFSVPDGRRGDVAARIERALASSFGVRCRVTALTRSQLAAVVRDNPYPGAVKDPSRLLVMVPGKPAELARLEPLLGQRWGRESLSLGKRVAYVWCAKGVAESVLWPKVDRALERSGTARNLGTMTKLLDAL